MALFDDDQPTADELLFRDSFRNPSAMGKDSDPDFQDQILTDAAHSKSTLEEGIVVKVHPKSHTVDVDTDNGTLSGCRIMAPYIGPLGSGFSIMPEVGANAIVDTGLEIPVVVGFVAEGDTQDTDQDSSKSPGITCGTTGYGGQDVTYDASSDVNYRGGRTDDAAPGDILLESADGNLVAVLRGITVLKGSELSQLVLSNLGGLVRMVSNLYQHFHAAGNTEIKNEDGRTSYSMRIGANAKDNGTVEPLATFQVGSEGDLIDVLVTTEDGEKKFRCHIGRDGALEVETADASFEINGDFSLEVDEDTSISVGGSRVITIGGTNTKTVAQNDIEQLGGSKTLDVGANISVKSIGDTSFITQGRFGHSVVGETTLNHTANVTRTLTNAELLYKVAVGPLTQASVELKRTGDITLTCLKAAKLGGTVSTEITGTTVNLGSSPVRHPVLRTVDLRQFAEAIVNYITTTGTSPGGKIVIPPGIGAALSPTIAAVGSKTVKAS